MAVRSGKDCVCVLRIHYFDLAIVDINVPDMDGFKLLEKIRYSYPKLKIFIITGCGTLDIARKALTMGAFSYFDKPIDLQRFIQKTGLALKSCLDLSKSYIDD